MAKNSTNGVAKPQSTMGYFRAIFKENPKLLKTRSNEEILQRWLADNPSFKEVPQRVKNTLSNLKSVLRKKRRQRRGKRSEAMQNGAEPAAASKRLKPSSLEALEIQIDDCLSLARALDPQGLENVIRLLRKARNEVVWKIGQ
jgi:hypothetical protein